jgi:hypothetical protein
MVGVRAVLCKTFQERCFRGFRQRVTGRCVRSLDTWSYWKEEVSSISVLSNSHFVSPRNSKRWLKYLQFCAKSFRNNGLEDLDTVSLVDVYDRLIHAAIEKKKSPPYLSYQTHNPWKTWTSVHTNYRIVVTLVSWWLVLEHTFIEE